MTNVVSIGGKREHILYDFFDQERKRAVHLCFEKKLKKGQCFDFDGVTYQVVDADHAPSESKAVVRMVRYKIPNTATQFVHKCPAKKGAIERLDREDIIKIEEKTKKPLSERVKMRSHATKELTCPHCKTVFWKEALQLPEEVQVNKVLGKKKRKKS